MQGRSTTKKRLLIVGGGTSGWMTAALLGRHLDRREYEITLVAEEDSGIGVGEATIPSVLRLLRTLEADEAEFMRACDATWKLGIQFSDWLKPDHDYWHPFGICGGRIDQRDLFPYWLMEKKRPYHTYSLHWAAAVAGKSPHSLNTRSPIAAAGSYAFHLNAKKFGHWLQQQALRLKVIHVKARVVSADRDADGDVSSVMLSNGDTVNADFFIDCSGFESVLLRKTLADPWIDWSNHLLCNRAVAVRIPGTPAIPSHTRSRALSAGWCWEIPLQNQRGLGYVYSHPFVSDDVAMQELQRAYRLSDTDISSALFLKMQVGRQTQFWHHNVLAIGLSAGFVEPLESSGLHLAHVGVERFLELFAITGDVTALRSQYNRDIGALFDDVRDFVQLHYHLNQRDESFWTAARDSELSNRLQHRLRLYAETGTLDALESEAFPESSYYFLLTGNQRLPKRPPALAMAVDRERLRLVLQAMRDQNKAAMRALPLHEEMLKHVYLPLEKAS